MTVAKFNADHAIFARKYTLPLTGTGTEIADAAKAKFGVGRFRVREAIYGGGRQVEVWGLRRSRLVLLATYSPAA